MSTTPELKPFVLTLEDREDGGLHIYSEDVPGLHLSGPDPEALYARVPLIMQRLLLANRGLHVTQVYLPAIEVALRGPMPKDVTAQARCLTVVVELEAAA